ncbi:MAG: NAD(P)-dependent oxidoreductase [Mesorhizobium sp.]
MHLLVTGASGKLGRRVVARLLRTMPDAKITAMTHSRDLDLAYSRLRVIKGSIADRGFVDAAMKGVTHVLHMATCKEIPELVMDVTVKGMFWLLEAFREQQGRYFILIGGDAAIGHFFYPSASPLTEATPHRAAPGCYSLSKVLEEVMLAQAHIQYGIEGCCLRAPWIMADDDLRYALSFSEDVFGSPRWHEAVAPSLAARYAADETVPLALAIDGKPLRRNIIAVDDVVDAVQAALTVQPAGCETFNIAMNEPFDYGKAASYIGRRFGKRAVEIATPYHSIAIDNSKARDRLGWTPRFDTERQIDTAWAFVPEKDAQREVIYPG